jgi:hypothetical protein
VSGFRVQAKLVIWIAAGKPLPHALETSVDLTPNTENVSLETKH